MNRNVSAIFLSAGKSQRMGQNKLLMHFRGAPLIKWAIKMAQSLDLLEVLFVTGHESSLIEPSIAESGFRSVKNDLYETGLHSSIQKGFAELKQETCGVLVYLCDQPQLDVATVGFLIENFKLTPEFKLFRPIYDGRPGNPCILSSEFKKEILQTSGADRGCSYLFKKYPTVVKNVQIFAPAVLHDLDRSEDFINLRNNESTAQ